MLSGPMLGSVKISKANTKVKKGLIHPKICIHHITVHKIKVNGGPILFGDQGSSKCSLLCSTKERNSVWNEMRVIK